MATVPLSTNVALTEGLLAFALLIFLLFGVTWLSIRSSTFRCFVKNEPNLLFYDGGFLRGDMGRSGLPKRRSRRRCTSKGSRTSRKLGAAILGTDGSVTVVPRTGLGRESVLSNVASQRSGEVRS